MDLKQYLSNLQNTFNRGDAREESYYKHLEELILQFAESQKIKKVSITILPKKTEAGNPDFRVWDGGNHITGYIEAKDPSITNLDTIENSEQLKRYRSTFPNVILTNFYEFRLYRKDELIKKVFIGRPFLAKKLKIAPPAENEKEFMELMGTFFSFSLPQISDSKTLALELAKRTRFLRDEVISIEIAVEEKQGKKLILQFYDAFKKYLIGTLTPSQFADLYSQTITYGLFAARTRVNNVSGVHSDVFNRELAFKYIPNTIGVLRYLFRFISLEESPVSLRIIVDDISEILNVTDVKKILQDYYREGKGKDPIIHFYETFLTVYDPKIREKRGVYYTPEPVVSYIVKAINQVLKSHFNLYEGLASPELTLLDPAAGTLTFPAEAIKLSVKEYTNKYGSGGKSKLIKTQILQNFYAFELMMAPYAIGHLKMSFLFEELGYRLEDDERFKLYLTNTLEVEDLEQIQIPGLSSLSVESHLAGKIKKEQSLLVILGNPPYSGVSSNMEEWAINLVKKTLDGAQSYYELDGKPLGEKKVMLQDDYVKFLRFAQWKIHKAGFGIVGMITNHSYLDNPTFRGMRQSLMKTFNEIYILDLHGNSLKKETAPNGGKDENVFDIRQGTAIVIFIKQKDKNGCRVFHANLYGLRESKYDWLDFNDFKPENYHGIMPESPGYFFVPRDTEKIKHYLKWPSLTNIFPLNVTGILTSKDSFAINFDKNALRNKILMIRNKEIDDITIKNAFGLSDNYQWKLTEQRELFRKIKDWENYFQKVLYRPFDVRDIYYQENIVFRTRNKVMRHMLNKPNFALGVSKRVEGAKPWEHIFISQNMITHHSVSMKEVNFLFPLYLFKDKTSKKVIVQSMMLFEPETDYINEDKTINIDKAFYDRLYKTYNTQPSPEEILFYIYGLLYSNIYRKKYAEFLRIDFPRVPFTSDYKIFKQMSEFGKLMTDLHLLKTDAFVTLIAKYQGEGANDRVEKVIYNEQENRVYINPNRYFDGVTSEVWNYQIGGYQVLKKYLADRAKAKREIDEKHYCRMVTAIAKTIELQVKIDILYPEIEKATIQYAYV
jgi:hypothetical protein